MYLIFPSPQLLPPCINVDVQKTWCIEPTLHLFCSIKLRLGVFFFILFLSPPSKFPFQVNGSPPFSGRQPRSREPFFPHGGGSAGREGPLTHEGVPLVTPRPVRGVWTHGSPVPPVLRPSDCLISFVFTSWVPAHRVCHPGVRCRRKCFLVTRLAPDDSRSVVPTVHTEETRRESSRGPPETSGQGPIRLHRVRTRTASTEFFFSTVRHSYLGPTSPSGVGSGCWRDRVPLVRQFRPRPSRRSSEGRLNLDPQPYYSWSLEPGPDGQ